MDIVEKITFVVGILILIILWITGEKNNRKNKQRWNSILLWIAGICIIGGKIIPATQNIIKFDSPEAAYWYKYFETNPVVIEGGETDFVVGKNSVVLLKDEEGWRIPETFSFTSQSYKKEGDVEIRTYLYVLGDVKEYYVGVCKTSGEKIEVTDNQDAQFYMIERNSTVSNQKNYYYMTYVEKMNDEYTLIVNDEEIKLLEEY